MIKTRGISKQEVFAVATKIASGGVMPTTASIRRELGRGNGTTLYNYLQEWKVLLPKHVGRMGIGEDLTLLDESNILRQNVEGLTKNLRDYGQQINALEAEGLALQ